MTWRRWNFLLWPFVPVIALLLIHHDFATAWSNRCDPGNATFFLMKDDAVTSFHAPGQAFNWENDGPDNSYACDAPSLSLSHVGLDVDGMFDAVRGDMTRNGWVETGALPGEDFAVYRKTIQGLQFEATVSKDWYGVGVFMTGPESPHFGEYAWS